MIDNDWHYFYTLLFELSSVNQPIRVRYMSTSMNISLPEALKEYVKERCREGDFSNSSDYIRALIREDRKQRAQEKLEALIDPAHGSPQAILQAAKTPPHIEVEDIETLNALIEEGKQPVRYRDPFQPGNNA